MDRQDPPPTYVALDLETTGLNADRDAIIEVGAVKFEGERVLETFQSLVNPYREIPPFVQRLTGIAQRSVDRAPAFGAVAGEIREFVGSLPVIGHNVSFDLTFLAKNGLQLHNDPYDTWDLASILLPYFTDYSLLNLATELGTGHKQPHRALPDAQATRGVFLALVERAHGLDPAIGAYMRHMAARARWPLRHIFGSATADGGALKSPLGLDGVDWSSLGKRLTVASRPLRPAKDSGSIDEEELVACVAPDGPMSRRFPGFQHRQQQVEMLGAVAGAIKRGEHLIVEAGTGVGKSIAYLLPAILHSLRNGLRVVVSTNTINLQEQLLQKDIPALLSVLEAEGTIPPGEFKAVSLKGRANYLCLRRWGQLARGEDLSSDDARILSKTLLWLQDTSSGDRSEINLSGRDASTWDRISAAEKSPCPGMRGDGPCFLRSARDGAEGAHLIVVNHALLLSDLAMGGGLLPDYHCLIVDEAQHLEEQATRQLGSQVSQNQLDEELDSLTRLLGEIRMTLRSYTLTSVQMQRVEELVAEMDPQWTRRMKGHWAAVWGAVEDFLRSHNEEGRDRLQLRITRSTRAQPDWSRLELEWENADLGLADGIGHVERLGRFLETIDQGEAPDLEGVIMELSGWRDGVEELRQRLKTLLSAPAEEQRIDWAVWVEDRRGSDRSYVLLHSVPLNVGPDLNSRLFSKKSSVVLTSATLSTDGNFEYIRERTGLEETSELLLGSPFDYKRAALVLVPEDMPMPNSWDYQAAMEKVLLALAKAMDGHTLALFTSHAALRGVAANLRGPLELEGVRLLAQGIDGNPRRILQSFAQDPRSVILGTSSFWEGVDISGGALKALVLARLPFHVPSEPIFAARSAQYEDPFVQYALPQAVLRFRQGIGRLIRSSEDKGTIVVLDKRIIARKYGKAFLDSVSACTVRLAPLSAIPDHAASWVGPKA